MRYSLMASLLVVAGCTTGWAEETARIGPSADIRPLPAAQHTVYLNHLVLEALRTSNPRHYAQARQVMAAAAELCKPGAPEVLRIGKLPAASCSAMALKTSNPPKREISFVIDDTKYIALVTMEDATPTFHPAGAGDAPAPVIPAK